MPNCHSCGESVTLRLIDADALRDEFDPDDKTEFDATGIRYYIASAPTIDAVSVVHGRWIPCDYKPSLYCKCSECGRRKEWLENMEWCPRCGAKMEKEADHA